MSTPISRRSAFVYVEYDSGSRGTTIRKRSPLLPAVKARGLFIRKFKEGKNPTIIKES